MAEPISLDHLSKRDRKITRVYLTILKNLGADKPGEVFWERGNIPIRALTDPLGVLPLLSLEADRLWSVATGGRLSPILTALPFPQTMMGSRYDGFHPSVPSSVILPCLTDAFCRSRNEHGYDLSRVISIWAPAIKSASEEVQLRIEQMFGPESDFERAHEVG